jgi:hypothetical protein
MYKVEPENPEELRSSPSDENQGGVTEAITDNVAPVIETVSNDGRTGDAVNASEIQEESAPDSEQLTQKLKEIERVLPPTLQKVLAPIEEPHERFMMLLGAITCSGGMAPMSFTNYDRRKNYGSLYTMLLLPPASGKGVLTLLPKWVKKVNDHLLKESSENQERYRYAAKEYKKKSADGNIAIPPKRPPYKILLVPGNVTSPAMIQLFNDSEGKQILLQLESEIDVFTAHGKSDFFSLNSIMLRQAFHHEVIADHRKTNQEHHSCSNPKLSIVMTGTPDQVKKLINNANDGLFSRFSIFYGKASLMWKDVSGEGSEVKDLDELFETLAEDYYQGWLAMKDRVIQVVFSKNQWSVIDKEGRRQLPELHEYLGPAAASIIKRHMLMLVRVALILTVVRAYDEKNIDNKIQCSDDDFKIAQWLISESFKYAVKLYKELPGSKDNVEEGAIKHKFYKNLPASFRKDEITDILEKIGISVRSAERYLKSFTEAGILVKVKRGEYRKP